MLAVGRRSLAANGGLSLPKLNVILARALARSGPLSTGIVNAAAAGNQAALVPFVKANLPLITSMILREYATAAKTKAKPKKKPAAVAAKKPAAKKPAAAKKTTTAATKKKATTAGAKKKPAAKRAVAKKTGTRRAATKKKPIAKKKKPVKKVVKKKKKAVIVKKPGIMDQFKNAMTDAPTRRPVMAYTLFFKDQFPTAQGDSGVTSKAKSIGAAWKALSEAEKQVWKDKAAAETVKKLAHYDQWIAKQNPADLQVANRARVRIADYRAKHNTLGYGLRHKFSDPRMVKRALTAYMYFSKETMHKAEWVGLRQAEKLKKTGELWRTISDAEKKKYVDLATRDRNRYLTEKAEFEKKYPSTVST
ncbi:hypothetical protein ABW20_dc0106068 [Dactylellina cionopaga]|nr:hypothetical protein ABW20_dc0106068 [Dactylellina cionopaga]